MNGQPVVVCADLAGADIERLLARYGIEVAWLPAAAAIPGSFWGEPEAGLVGQCVFARPDTPLHSLLHEASHVVCMTPGRRAVLHRDAGSDDLEEAAVCYLQIVLADRLPGVGRQRLMRDMDTWGYSFRLGSTARWFAEDAGDAKHWLVQAQLLTPADEPLFRLRGTG